MAATMKNVRVKLSFLKFPTNRRECFPKSWFLVNTVANSTISDVAQNIVSKFSCHDECEVKLMLDDCLLPAWESVSILQDNDEICVVGTPRSQTEQDVLFDIEASTSAQKKSKKKKKRKYYDEELPTNQPSSELFSQLDRSFESQVSSQCQMKDVNTKPKQVIEQFVAPSEPVKSSKKRARSVSVSSGSEDESEVASQVETSKTKKDKKESPQKKKDAVLDNADEPQASVSAKQDPVVPSETAEPQIKKKRVRRRNRNKNKGATNIPAGSAKFGVVGNVLNLFKQSVSNTPVTPQPDEKTPPVQSVRKPQQQPPQKQWQRVHNSPRAAGNHQNNSKHVKFNSDSEDMEEDNKEPNDNTEQISTPNVQYEVITNEEAKDQEIRSPQIKAPNTQGHNRDNQNIATPDNRSKRRARQHWTPDKRDAPDETGVTQEASTTPSRQGHRRGKEVRSFQKGPFVNVQVFDRRKNKKAGYVPLSKEEQLNTVAENISYIYENDEETCDESVQQSQIQDAKASPQKSGKSPDQDQNQDNIPEEKPEEVLPPKDYSVFKLLVGPPRVGETIAYKILEMSDNYCPDISDYREAKVQGYDPLTQTMQLELTRHMQRKKGRFEVIIEDEGEILTNSSVGESQITVQWPSLIEPRLVTE